MPTRNVLLVLVEQCGKGDLCVRAKCLNWMSKHKINRDHIQFKASGHRTRSQGFWWSGLCQGDELTGHFDQIVCGYANKKWLLVRVSRER